MTEERKIVGAIYDSLLSDKQSDERFDKVPDVPENLVKKTLDICDVVAAKQIRIDTFRPKKSLVERFLLWIGL